MSERISARMRELLLDYARHEASTDEYLGEGMSFPECLELMDHVATAVEKYAGLTTTNGAPR